MLNFLAETEHAVKCSNHTTDDVHYISSHSKNFTTNWMTFAKFSNFEYDAYFPYIVSDLVIVFTDGSYLKRTWNSDYSFEHWKFIKTISINNNKKLTHKKMLLN